MAVANLPVTVFKIESLKHRQQYCDFEPDSVPGGEDFIFNLEKNFTFKVDPSGIRTQLTTVGPTQLTPCSYGIYPNPNSNVIDPNAT